MEPKIEIINGFVEKQIVYYEEYAKSVVPMKSNIEVLDALLRKYVTN
jgi:hypothetical protein